MKTPKPKTIVKNLLSIAPMLVVSASLLFTVFSYNTNLQTTSYSANQGHMRLDDYSCGGSPVVNTTINFGCAHTGNPITAIIFAVIRFLSAGVGLVIILSVIIGGIQYILSRGDPNATSKAVNRLVSAVVALVLYIFAYAILSYVIPQGFFR